MMKNIIKKLLREQLMDEDYPASWDINKFKELTSFTARIKYCQDNLQRISSGSSRIVYKIDDEKVLKLARNKKGLAQNEIEISHGGFNDISDITAKIFDSDENNLWVEMELARKLTAPKFKQIVGFEWIDFIETLQNYYYRINPKKPSWYRVTEISEVEKEMWENEFCYSILNFIANYDIPVGDLMRLNSYGIVIRDGADTVVLIDYGLTNDVWKSYY